MAVLEHLCSGKTHVLTSPFLVGRSSACTLCLSSRLVSGEHASFHWSKGSWQVRDLDSRNGTFHNGRRLTRQERIQLAIGSKIAFGDPDDVFEIKDDSPPVAVARSATGDCVEARDGELLLPTSRDSEFIVFEDRGFWCIHDNSKGISRRAIQRESVQAGGQRWTLFVPEVGDETRPLEPEEGIPEHTEVHFDVSSDQEHIAITVHQNGHAIALKSLAHSYFLLVLARARLDDVNDPEVLEADRGWMHVAQLSHMLRTSANQIGSLIFRARKQFCAANVVGYNDIIESRPGTGQRRLGVSRIFI